MTNPPAHLPHPASADGGGEAPALEALGDPTRRRIFELVAGGGMAVGEVAARLPVSQPAVSQHLKVLLEAGLVEVEPQGRRRLYRARPAGLEGLRRWVASFWDGVLDAYVRSFDEEGGGG